MLVSGRVYLRTIEPTKKKNSYFPWNPGLFYNSNDRSGPWFVEIPPPKNPTKNPGDDDDWNPGTLVVI